MNLQLNKNKKRSEGAEQNVKNFNEDIIGNQILIIIMTIIIMIIIMMMIIIIHSIFHLVKQFIYSSQGKRLHV